MSPPFPREDNPMIKKQRVELVVWVSKRGIIGIGKGRGEVQRSFPRQVTREDPAVTVQVDQVGKQRCVVGGPGIPPEASERGLERDSE